MKDEISMNCVEIDEYEPVNDDYCDLCSIYYFHDDPPSDLLIEWEGKAYDPFMETVMRKIGNTWYFVSTACNGTETLDNKVKRLIFTDPIPEKEMTQG